MTDQLQLHNRIAGRIVDGIVRPPLEAGGSPADVMILLESVVVGVSLAVIRLGGDEAVLDVVMERARARLAELRLGPLPPAGRA